MTVHNIGEARRPLSDRDNRTRVTLYGERMTISEATDALIFLDPDWDGEVDPKRLEQWRTRSLR